MKSSDVSDLVSWQPVGRVDQRRSVSSPVERCGDALSSRASPDWAGRALLGLTRSPSGRLSGLLKRVLDLVGAGLALLLLSPLLIVVAILIKWSSPGPVIYRQVRYGLHGRTLVIWKFRSMYVHDEAKAHQQVSPADPRVTPLGHLIRRWSIDELPQLVQVMAGSMSLVGPRPHPVWLDEDFQGRLAGYAQRRQVKPGLTGWAQVQGWRGPADSLQKMEMRLRHDLHYIQNWSLWLDLRIILMTPVAIIQGRNVF